MSMSPTTKPVRNVKVNVPRHNSQRIGPAVTAQVETYAREDRVRIDISQTAPDPNSALGQAIESASEWNSLLLTARAERGPQWDIGTQQFLVEEYSDLYYDPTALLAYQKEARPPMDGEDVPSTSTNTASNEQKIQEQLPGTPRNAAQRPPTTPHTPHHSSNQFFSNNLPPNIASPRHPFPTAGQAMAAQGMSGQGMGFGNMNMNMSINPAQLFAGGPDSPMRLSNPGMAQAMGGMGMNMSGMGMGMNMSSSADAMSMSIGSPDPRRRLTRGMSGEDGFGGMHG
ncbi:uncharacterized protein LAESUDRAFT_764308 [Laetiporus sulphureus 93-53]|uniref:Uncharacterized protein n=1 Tax=Laetiporus sulphureus 93-53 TaxID=1314785 RepID=A0A165BD18_9APHY|nr:uncharacterized protein LAESUDRAFT_764308 [Laetiporus sulphureus 93-53]KZT00775.1 hypothetical protein LAESUDRAFT_764308 [Laetiporus sulphureus 93-53]